MQGGDLDNTPVPRVYIVVEGTLVRRPEKPSITDRILSRRHRVQIDPEVRTHLWDAWQRLNVRFDAVTFDYDPQDIQTLFDQENIPVDSVYSFASREEFIAALPRMPWVHTVIDHERPLAYGGRGGSLDTVRR